MKKARYFAICLATLSFLASCTSTSKVQTNMSKQRHSLAYIMDSRISDAKSSFSVKIKPVIIANGLINDNTIVSREKSSVIPLILYNSWFSQSKCTLGKSAIEEDISSFFRNSLINEINRSGIFLSDSTTDSAYTLEIAIDEFKTEGSYISSGFFYFALFVYGYAQSEIAGPATSTLKVAYNLKKDEKEIYGNTFFSTQMTEQINRKYTNIKLLHQDYAISMVEAKSKNIKRAIEFVVNDLNSFFANTVE